MRRSRRAAITTCGDHDGAAGWLAAADPPAESAGTVDFRIFALSLWPSKITKADHYVYK